MRSDQHPSLPLAGVTVLDLSRVLAGPLCAMALGDLGADVIKIEHPERGDDTRGWGMKIGTTDTTYFYSANRNKRSLTVDLATPDGRTIVEGLVRTADVLVENFKTGGMEKLGLGYARLRELNPRLIYCSISGYGRDGAEANRPGYDIVAQAESGLMSINGEASGPPLKFGVAVVDMVTGLYAAQAVLATLFERQRTGRGRRIDLALFDGGVMISSYYGLEALVGKGDPPRFGNAHPSVVPYGVFDAADGPVAIAVGTNEQFDRFCRHVLKRPDLADDARYASNFGRSRHRAELLAELRGELAAHRRGHLMQELAEQGIPCGEVLGLHQALTSERTRQAGLVVTHRHPQAGDVPVLAPPYRLDGERLPVGRPPPQLGEHSAEILAERLFMDADQIAGQRRLKTI